jgi:hypothetical protein
MESAFVLKALGRRVQTHRENYGGGHGRSEDAQSKDHDSLFEQIMCLPAAAVALIAVVLVGDSHQRAGQGS